MVDQHSVEIAADSGPILVTGVNGYIASNIANAFLRRGYTVRGTTRSLQRSHWVQDLFDKEYGPGRFTLVEVPNLADEKAFDKEIKQHNVVAVISTTSIMDFSQTDPEKVIPPSVNLVLTHLRVAARHSSVKSVVFTSSAWAASTPKANTPGQLNKRSWNEEAVAAAYAPSFDDATSRGLAVFMASFAKREQALWHFVRENKPHYRFNSMLVDTVFGKILSAEHQGFPSTAAFLNGPGGVSLGHMMVAPQWFVDVEDVANLHVAAAIRRDVSSERIYNFGAPFNFNEIQRILKVVRPEVDWGEEDPNEGNCLVKVTNERGDDLLKEIRGSGWTSLEESVRKTVQNKPFTQVDLGQFSHPWQ